MVVLLGYMAMPAFAQLTERECQAAGVRSCSNYTTSPGNTAVNCQNDPCGVGPCEWVFSARCEDASVGGSGSGSGGGTTTSTVTPVETTITFENPTQNETIFDLIGGVMTWIQIIFIPIAVIMIIFAGVRMLTARGKPEAVQSGKKILLWAIAGLAIIIIGRGFITLINSIIALGT